jgi:hypothetical protein
VLYFLLICIVLSLGYSKSVISRDTIVGGILTENAVWTNKYNYIVNQNLTVPSGIELSIMPGTHISFAANTGLFVIQGSLKVFGSYEGITDTIHFLPQLEETWLGITLSDVNGENNNFIDYALIKGADYGIKIEESNHIIVSNVRVSGSIINLQLINSSNNLIVNSEFIDNFSVGVDIFANGGKQSINNIVEKNVIANSQATNLRVGFVEGGICKNNIIRNNIFDGARYGIFIGNSSIDNIDQILIEGNVFKHAISYGVSSGMDSTILINNIFWKNGVAVELRRGRNFKLERNNFYQNDNGLIIRFAKDVLIDRNTFTKNHNQVVVFHEAVHNSMKGSNIMFNELSENIIRNETSSEIEIFENFWGSTDTLFITHLLWDKDDNETLGELLFLPFLMQADTQAPISAPTSFIKQRVGSNTKLSWRANPEADVLGYALYQGQFSEFYFVFDQDPMQYTDTSIIVPGDQLDMNFGLTAYDQGGIGFNNQRSGHESPFAFALAMPYAGPDTAICNNIPTFAINQSTVPFTYNQLNWSTDGDGSFNNPALLGPLYTIGEEDAARGSVKLTLTVQRNGEQFQHGFILTLSNIPTVFAGDDLILPLQDSILLSDAEAMFYSNLFWESNGDGYFDDPSQLHPVYYFGEQDSMTGELQLVLSATSACGTVSDTLNIYLRNQFLVEGRVLANGQGQSGAAVLAVSSLVNSDTYIVAHTNTDNDGRFNFADLFAADYHFYALPDTAESLAYLPTYYANKIKWQHAFSLPLTANTYQVEIELTPSPVNLPAGNGRISGKFELPAQMNDFEKYCMPWFADSHPAYCNGGLSNVSIILYNDQYNIPMASTITDQNGHFFFNNLPYGRYFIDAEKAGFETTVSDMIELSPAVQLRNNIVIRLEGQKNIKFYLPEISWPHTADVFPNPVNDWMNLKMALAEDETALVNIYNTAGELLIQEVIDYAQLSLGGYHRMDLSGLPMGAYYGQLISQNKALRFRFVVSR